MCDLAVHRPEEKRKKKEEIILFLDTSGSKGLLVVNLFYGFLGLLVFGFIAIMLTPVFANLSPSFDSTLQLFIIAMIPFMGLAILWGIKDGLGR